MRNRIFLRVAPDGAQRTCIVRIFTSPATSPVSVYSASSAVAAGAMISVSFGSRASTSFQTSIAARRLPRRPANSLAARDSRSARPAMSLASRLNASS